MPEVGVNPIPRNRYKSRHSNRDIKIRQTKHCAFVWLQHFSYQRHTTWEKKRKKSNAKQAEHGSIARAQCTNYVIHKTLNLWIHRVERQTSFSRSPSFKRHRCRCVGMRSRSNVKWFSIKIKIQSFALKLKHFLWLHLWKDEREANKNVCVCMYSVWSISARQCAGHWTEWNC